METETIDIAGTGLAARSGTLELGSRPSRRSARLLVRDSDVFHVVNIRNVEWIDACGNCIEIHTGGKTLLHRGTLKGITDRLPANEFARIHRSLIVNTRMVRELRRVAGGKCCLVMSSGESLSTNRPMNQVQGALMES